MHDRRLIRDLRSQGLTIRQIAAEVGASPDAVLRALAPGAADHYRRPSTTEEYAEAVAGVLEVAPHWTAQQIAEVVRWDRSLSQLRRLIAQLRPMALAHHTAGLRVPTVGTLRVGAATTGPLYRRAVGRTISPRPAVRTEGEVR